MVSLCWMALRELCWKDAKAYVGHYRAPLDYNWANFHLRATVGMESLSFPVQWFLQCRLGIMSAAFWDQDELIWCSAWEDTYVKGPKRKYLLLGTELSPVLRKLQWNVDLMGMEGGVLFFLSELVALHRIFSSHGRLTPVQRFSSLCLVSDGLVSLLFWSKSEVWCF